MIISKDRSILLGWSFFMDKIYLKLGTALKNKSFFIILRLFIRHNMSQKPNNYIFLLIVFTFSFLGLKNTFAQSNTLAIDKEYNLWFEPYLIYQTDSFHSCIYPNIQTRVIDHEIVHQEMLMHSKSKLISYISNQDLINLFSNKLLINPIINIEQGLGSGNATPFYQSGGVKVQSNINTNLSVRFSVYGTRQHFGMFEQAQIDSTGYLPQTGKHYQRSGKHYTFLDWQGSITYQAGQYFHFQVGKEHNFWGDGYRSLLLSDNTSSYPFVKLTATVGKLQYIVLYQFLKDVDTNMPGYPEENKYSTSHFLSWNIGKRINLNLFETVIWRDKMDNGGKRGYDINYINPIIFFRPLEFEIGSAGNMLVGGGFRIRPFSNTHLYGQVILDEFKLDEFRAQTGWWANKYGYQIGVKAYDILGIKNLFVRGEYNSVRPFTYSHGSSAKNYGHLFRPLAHPLGANFKEVLGLVNYRLKRWQFQTKAIFAKLGTDSDSLNMGQNIYRSYNDGRVKYGNHTLQGKLNNLIQLELKTAYIVNPLWNLRAELGFRFFRWNTSSINRDEKYIFVGLKTIF